MTDELKPVRCGCGGEARVRHGKDSACWWVECPNCGISTLWHLRFSEADAVEAWNIAMGNGDKLTPVERTAKAVTRPFGDIDLHKCGNCQYYVDKSFTYCPGCGAKLEWE